MSPAKIATGIEIFGFLTGAVVARAVYDPGSAYWEAFFVPAIAGAGAWLIALWLAMMLRMTSSIAQGLQRLLERDEGED